RSDNSRYLPAGPCADGGRGGWHGCVALVRGNTVDARSNHAWNTGGICAGCDWIGVLCRSRQAANPDRNWGIGVGDRPAFPGNRRGIRTGDSRQHPVHPASRRRPAQRIARGRLPFRSFPGWPAGISCGPTDQAPVSDSPNYPTRGYPDDLACRQEAAPAPQPATSSGRLVHARADFHRAYISRRAGRRNRARHVRELSGAPDALLRRLADRDGLPESARSRCLRRSACVGDRGLAEYLIGLHLVAASGEQAQFGIEDVFFKLNEYWAPYFLVFPAAVLFDLIYRRVSKPLAVAVLLALLIFPWSQNPNVDISYNEHPLAVEWARNLFTAKLGWWLNSPDHRWAQSQRELELSEALRTEIRAGRITPATHIVHVTPQAIIWQDVLL